MCHVRAHVVLFPDPRVEGTSRACVLYIAFIQLYYGTSQKGLHHKLPHHYVIKPDNHKKVNCYWGCNVVDNLYLHKRRMSKRLLHINSSVAPIIGSAIGIGQYRPLSGISAVCLDFAYRYLVFKHEL